MLRKAVVWFERWVACVYSEFSVLEARSPFAEPGGLVLCGLRASQHSDSYSLVVLWGRARISCRPFLPLLDLCPGQLAGSLHHCEKSGQLLFLIAPSCTPEWGGSSRLGVCWGQTSPAVWHGHSSGPWSMSHIITAVWDWLVLCCHVTNHLKAQCLEVRTVCVLTDSFHGWGPSGSSVGSFTLLSRTGLGLVG